VDSRALAGGSGAGWLALLLGLASMVGGASVSLLTRHQTMPSVVAALLLLWIGVTVGQLIASFIGTPRPRRTSLHVVIGLVGVVAGPFVARVGRWPAYVHNEAATLGFIRAVISTQARYRETTGGYAGRLECLWSPGKCFPGYAESPADFIPLTEVRQVPGRPQIYARGYEYLLAPGAPASASYAGSSAVQSYALVAVPIEPGRTGVRAFCGESSGRICETRDGTPPKVENGECVIADAGSTSPSWFSSTPTPCVDVQ